MTLLFLALWLQMSAPTQIQPLQMYRSMCRMPRLEYGERYQVIAGRGECDVFERGVGEVYWQGPFGSEILFPIGSPLDDVVLSEIPDESAWGNGANGSCNMGKLVLANPVDTPHDIIWGDLKSQLAEAAQRAADETDGKPPKCANGSNCYCGDTGCRDYTQAEWDEFNRIMAEPVEPYKPPEPVDVPAVQVTKSRNTCVGYVYASPDLSAKEREAVCMVHTTVHSCADKSRILEHDENSPPKFWCRKVEF